MVTRSEDCVRRDACVQKGEGLIHIKELTNAEQLRGHGRLFNHLVVDPGCSIGTHAHSQDAEYYYIVRGEGLFDDNGTEVRVRAGDICYTADGATHALKNHTQEPLEVIALVIFN